ncbi:reticulon-4 receptor-like 2 [Lineus longissimus]|uniref:reticulon-4 receptor-like 2 n=1 Tax=Lineus longissimus TaxID=88925 RepID=UPI00315DE0AA
MASPLQKRVVLAIFTIFQICASTSTCPTQCSCNLNTKTMTCDGSKDATVTIDDAALSKILKQIPAGTEELVIKHASISKLTQGLFMHVKGLIDSMKNFTMTSSKISEIEPLAFENFIHITYLDLSDNNIVPQNYTFQELLHLKILKLNNAFSPISPNLQFPKKIFHGVEKLEILELCSNKIHEIPIGLFNGVCINLKSVNISGNRIHTLKNDTFKNCPKLKNLSIENSHLDGLDANAFSGLISLTQLNLQGNNLHTLRISHVEPIKNATINFDENPWTCDCSLIFFVQWLQKENVNLDLKCKWPLILANKQLLTLNVYDLGCEKPKVTEISKNPLKLFEGDNATFVVEAIGLPYVTVNCTHAKQGTNRKMVVIYRHSIHFDQGVARHFTTIIMDFVQPTISDSGNVTCHVHNILGEDKLVIILQVLKTDNGQRIDIVIFVSGIMAFVIAIGLLIACLNIRNKKQAEKEAKANELMAMKGHENHAFEDNVKSTNRRRDSIGYFPTSGACKSALVPSV